MIDEPLGASGNAPRWIKSFATRRLLSPMATLVVVASVLAVPGAAQAAETCGPSGGHTICLTVPGGPLTGEVEIGVTNDPNGGTVVASFLPSGKGKLPIPLITSTTPSPVTGDYSFIWPTHKYLDASGVLRVVWMPLGPATSFPVEVRVTLSNGNATDFQHTPNDWEDFLPGPWTDGTDPVVAAVGDGPSSRPATHQLAQSIVDADPDLFLYLGDIYENGTFTENLNHYGRNSMDGGPGTLWGQLGHITQPTLGNHEADNLVDWLDYFHGRPLYHAFRMGNVLFLNLTSSEKDMGIGSSQYQFVEDILTSATNPPPPCIVTYTHKPALSLDSVNLERSEIWKLLTDHGGDVFLSGHVHTMIEYKPLNRDLQLPKPGEQTMVQIINGAGHGEGNAYMNDVRVEWSKGKSTVGTYLTLNDAANGGTPTSISWEHRNAGGTVLNTGSRNCLEEPLTEPVFSQDLPDRTDEEEQVVSFSAGAIDPDGETVTYEATGLPPGITIDPGTGQVSGMIEPWATTGSPYQVEVTARDGTPLPPRITQVQRKSGHQNLVTSSSLTFGRPPTEGNLLIGVGEYNSNREPTIPEGWSLALDSNTNPETVIFYKVAGPAEPSTVPLSVSGSPNRISMAIFEYAGLSRDQAQVLDRATVGTASDATSVSTGTTLPTTEPDELLLASVGTGSNRIFQNAWTDGFKQQADGGRHTVGHRVVSEIGQYGTSESWNTPGGAVGALVSFKAGEPPEMTDSFTWTVVPRSACPNGRKPQALTFRNEGGTALIRVTDKLNPFETGGRRYFAGEVAGGAEFTAYSRRAGNGRFASTIWIHRYAADGRVIESIPIKADCSQPLHVRHWFGAHLLVDFVSEGEVVTPPTWSGPAAIAPPLIGGRNVDFNLVNFGEAREIASIAVTWPTAPNGRLSKVKLGGATLFATKTAGGEAMITAFRGKVAQRTLTAGAVGRLRFEFASNAARDPSAYSIDLTFRDGAIAMFPGPNAAPVVDSVMIDQAAPGSGETLTATVMAHDDDGHALTYSYQWAKNGADLPGETGATLDLSVPGNGDKGDEIAVLVTASDGAAESAPATSTVVTVVNADAAFSQDLPDRTDEEGQVVDLAAGATDPDGDALTYAATGLPPGISIDPDTGQISGTIAAGADADGPYQATVSVRDGTMPAGPEITQVQRKSGHENLVTSTSLTFDQPPMEGNLLVGVGEYNSNREPTLPDGWSLAVDSNTDPETVVFFKVAGPAESSVVLLTVSGSGTRISLAIFEYAGLSRDQAEVLDRVAVGTAADATGVSTGMTEPTTQAGELLLASVGTGGNRAFQNAWTNWFEQQTDLGRHTVAHRVVTETGRYETSESWDAPATAVGALVSFKAGEPPDAVDTFTWRVAPPSGCAEGSKPQALAFRNDGDTALIRVTDGSDPFDSGGQVYFAGEVAGGAEFAAYSRHAGEDRFPSTIWIHEYAADGSLVQSIAITADCSQPIRVGDTFGAFTLVDIVPEGEAVTLPGWDGPVVAGWPTFDGKKVDFTLLNLGGGAEIQEIAVAWPTAPNRKLVKVQLEGVTLFDTKSNGGAAVITAFEGDASDRTLTPGGIGRLRFQFERKAATDLSLYSLRVTFAGGHEVVVPTP